MKNYLNSILIFLFLLIPVITISVLMGINGFMLKILVKETLYNVTILVFILLFVYFIKRRILKKIVAIIFFIPFYSILFVKIFTLVNFFNFIDNAVLYTVFETNYSELTGFFSSYSKWYHGLFIISYFYILIKIILNSTFTLNFKIKKAFYVLPVIFICSAVSYRFYERSLSLLVFNTYLEYKTFSEEVSKEISKRESKYFSNVANNDEEALYVVIIGESTTRANMGIYGYYRNTNPNLRKIKNELHLFKDVISPHTHTILSLDKVLSLGDYYNPDNNKLGTVIQLANQAGFETYWLSNQKPIGAYESLIALYAKASKHQFYVSNFYGQNNKYDEVLFPKLQETINKKDRKKMIFVHLQGTHISYEQRYPESYQFFKDRPQTKFPSEEAFKLINDYDDAVRYNDYVVYQIIDKVKNANKNSYVVYFSDHGEEIFHDKDYFGHYEGIGTNAMFEIPFIVWTSEKYNEQSQINFEDKLDRKYNLEDFIYSFSELSRISFDQFQSEKSIFNSGFKYKNRVILKNINYDERLKKE